MGMRGASLSCASEPPKHVLQGRRGAGVGAAQLPGGARAWCAGWDRVGRAERRRAGVPGGGQPAAIRARRDSEWPVRVTGPSQRL